ncbi:MAG: hypothetical protein KDD38_01630 [Bdellovibrionales bacterium]|nr:hypothetical protein [Bdellovibrionales bacterium]
MKVRAVANSIILVVVSTLLLFNYNNCSSKHDESSLGSAGANISGGEYWTCADQLDDMSLFGRTYHSFLMNNCAACHSGGGPGPSAFASSGINLAFNSFNAIGFSTVNMRAQDGHSPSSGPQNTAPINDLTSRYIDGLKTIETCKTQGGTDLGQNQDDDTRLKLVSKAISPNLTRPVTVTWNLANDSLPLAGFDKSKFTKITLTVDVQLFQKPGIINYIVSNPRINSNSQDVRIESLLFKINGYSTPAQRAFYLLDKNIRAWNSSHPDFGKPGSSFEYQARLISGGSLVMLGDVHSTDVISVSIGSLEAITLPPPDLGPAIRFGQTTMQVNENYQIVSIPLVLSKPATETSSAEIVFGEDTTIKDECCRTTRNDDGVQIKVRHFDRDIQDFDLDSNLKLNSRINFNAAGTPGRYLISFREGDTTANLRIKIVSDSRDELNEVLHLKIDPLRLNNITSATTNQEFRLTIVDNDNPYNGNAETYTDLLSDGGLLADQCLRCHNSVLNRGGYDITHYELMVIRNILIPGSPNSSLMFRRMDANTPGLLPMPLTGLLDPLDRSRVSSWIQLGAPNN